MVDTLDDHGAAVTAVRFAAAGKSLISCSADGGIVFRCVQCILSRWWQAPLQTPSTRDLGEPCFVVSQLLDGLAPSCSRRLGGLQTHTMCLQRCLPPVASLLCTHVCPRP